MKTTLTEKKRKVLRRIYGFLSLSSALFVFEACYGTPHDMGLDIAIQGFVKSKITNQPVAGIKVSLENNPQYEVTGTTGEFKIYASLDTEYKVKFEDMDPLLNGSFLPKDTVIKIVDKSIFLQVTLDAK